MWNPSPVLRKTRCRRSTSQLRRGRPSELLNTDTPVWFEFLVMRVRQYWTGYREIISKSFKLTTAISTACVKDPHAETRCVKCRLLSESHTRRHKCVKYRLLRSTGGSSICVPLIEVRTALANLGPQCNRVTSCNQRNGPGEDQVEVRTALANLSY